ncbi:HEAT repeat domain-containing protein [Engelhardtia mirabilis]|uniref:Membrane alanyl aminopeptidase n=1 Tax=Engelhardtia mirabilis TaxID=2528011 RepID=A0A518BJ13_9BACT|nr:hypothetical protein Pla133_20460 [Planctomycetes bacterium Pla133]QDV01298.1 hypothetical protein Pla86_20470 [Planctomycetes bacterium Pla86]
MISFPQLPSAVAPVLLLVASTLLGGCRSATVDGRPEGASEPAPEAPPVALEHVSLALSVDPEARVIHGLADLRVRADAPRVEWLPLRLERLAVESVTDAAGAELPFSHQDGELAIMLGGPLLEGETIEVQVAYSGRPERGLAFVDEPAIGGRVAVTDGRPGTSAWWYPSVVRPGQRITSDLTLDLPASWIAAGSGRRQRTEADGRATVRFDSVTSHAPDQLGFAAGPYLRVATNVAGVELSALGAPVRRADLEAALAELVRALAFGRELIGAAALPPSMSVVHAPSAQRPGAGAFGVAFVEDLGRSAVATRTLDSALCGALVAKEWSDVWLAPALGRYATALYVESIGGREALTAALEQAAIQGASRRPDGPTGALSTEDFVDPSDLVDGGWRGAVGAQVLHLVRGVAGDAAFVEGLRELITAGREGAVTDDFFFARVGALAQLDLTTLREQWVDAPGAPDIEVSWDYDASAGEVALRVRQRQSGGDGTPRVFEVPVEVEVVVGSQTDVHRTAIGARKETLRFTATSRPRWVRFDRGGWLPGTIVEQKSDDEWMALTTARDDAFGRAVAVQALARTAVNARESERAIYLTQLGGRLERDDSARVRRAAAHGLGDMGGNAARLWLERAARVDEDASVRAAALTALEAFAPSVDLANLAVQRMEQDPEVAVAAIGLRAAAEPESAASFLRSRWSAAPDPRVRAALVEALAANQGSESEPWLLTTARDVSQPTIVRRAALGALADRSSVTNKTADGVAALLDEAPVGVREAAVEALAAWPNAPARRALEAHYAHSVEPAERRVIEAALRLDR